MTSAHPEPAATPFRPGTTAEPDAPMVLPVLDAVAVEIEAHLAASGWDGPPALFALVATRVLAADPEGASALGLDPATEISEQSLTPVAQDDLPDQPLDELLAGIEWPAAVVGCAVSQEILVLPPGAEAELSSPDAVGEAAAHPQRREARLVVAVTRAGAISSVLRLRAVDAGSEDDIAFGTDLAPNLTAALLATLA